MAEENTTDNTKNKKDTTGLSQFDLDKIAGVGMSKKQAKVIDTTDIDKQIAALEKPASGSVYDKLAARYRSQGEGAVLRTQKNLANLFGPTVNLIQEREAAAQARFTLLKDKLPEFDDTKIFGMQSGNEMPIVAEIERISKTTKEDMRMLSRLNPNDERYDEIKKRIDKNQNAIVAFDEINQKLLEIRNSQDGREDDSQWSRGMDSATRQMWEDIYASKGENITIQDGKLVWTSTGGKSKEIKTKSNALSNISSITEAPTEEKNIIKLQKNLQDLGYDIGSTGADGKYGPKTKAAYEKFLKEKESIQSEIDSAELEGVGETRVIDLNEIGDGPTTIDNLGIQKDIEIQDGIQVLINSDIEVTDPRYNQKINQLVRTLNSVGPKGIKSLIFDGFGASGDDVLTSVNTDSFIQQIIQNNAEDFGIKDINNLTEEEIANAYDIMRSRDVTYDYKNSEGTPQTLQSQYLQWYRNEIDTKVREGKKSKLVAQKTEQQNKTTTTTTEVPDPEEMTVDNRSGRTEALTSEQRANIWKEFYNKSEGNAEKALQVMFPNFIFTHRQPGRDVLSINDGEGNLIGTYDFDFSNINNAKLEADKFLNDLDNMGYNTIK
jgi:peptidoglycan hydrolase-like protein with peptidoglycan-binding domain